MADNTTLNAGTGGDTLRDVDKGGVKTPVVTLDLGGAGAESLIAGAMPVAGTFWQATQPVSAAALPLPAGAATSARQPALGTAGAAAADVLTIQGIASMVAVKVDGSAATQPVSGTVGISGSVAVTGTFWQATQPVSGTVTANVGTTNGLALDATLTGGSQKTKLVDSAGTNAATVSAAGAVKVDGSGVTQPVSIAANVTVVGTGTLAVQATQAGTWNVGTVTTVAAVTAITNALPAGSNTIGATTPAAATSGGATPYHLVSAASTNATSVKGSAGTVYSVSAFNTNASARYLKLYDKASSPTVGTDTPVATFLVPASGGGFTLPLPVGLAFSSGIALALTTGIGDSDTGAVGSGDLAVNLSYK